MIKKLEERIKKGRDGELKFVDKMERKSDRDFGPRDLIINPTIDGGDEFRNLTGIHDINNNDLYIMDKDDAGKYESDNILTQLPPKEYLLKNWTYDIPDDEEGNNIKDISVRIGNKSKKLRKFTLNELDIKDIEMSDNVNEMKITFTDGLVVDESKIEPEENDHIMVWSIVNVLFNDGYWYLPKDINLRKFRRTFIKALNKGSNKSIRELEKSVGFKKGDIHTRAFINYMNNPNKGDD